MTTRTDASRDRRAEILIMSNPPILPVRSIRNVTLGPLRQVVRADNDATLRIKAARLELAQSRFVDLLAMAVDELAPVEHLDMVVEHAQRRGRDDRLIDTLIGVDCEASIVAEHR